MNVVIILDKLYTIAIKIKKAGQWKQNTIKGQF